VGCDYAKEYAKLLARQFPARLQMPTNELYLSVLPLIHISSGLTEETLTLYPDRNFATEFYADEVQGYIDTFKNRIKYLVGGHSKGYQVFPEPTREGRVIVRVVQNVG
jgi:hypothetical protein